VYLLSVDIAAAAAAAVINISLSLICFAVFEMSVASQMLFAAV